MKNLFSLIFKIIFVCLQELVSPPCSLCCTWTSTTWSFWPGSCSTCWSPSKTPFPSPPVATPGTQTSATQCSRSETVSPPISHSVWMSIGSEYSHQHTLPAKWSTPSENCPRWWRLWRAFSKWRLKVPNLFWDPTISYNQLSCWIKCRVTSLRIQLSNK